MSAWQYGTLEGAVEGAFFFTFLVLFFFIVLPFGFYFPQCTINTNHISQLIVGGKEELFGTAKIKPVMSKINVL